MKKAKPDPRALQILADQYGPRDGAYEEILRGEFSGELIDPAIALGAITAALATQPPAVGVDVSHDLVEVVKFLLGEGPLEGVWFGDTPPAPHRPAQTYWWRKRLRSAAAALRTGGGE